MSTLIVYSSTADEYLRSWSTTLGYSSVRAGTASFQDASPTGTDVYVGQSGPSNFSIYQIFHSFDTSAIGVNGSVSSATLNLTPYGKSDYTTFAIEARLHDWGAEVTSADFVAGDDLGNKTLLATFPSTADWLPPTKVDFISDPGFISSINKTGITPMVLVSERNRLGVSPTGLEYVAHFSSDRSGTSNDPKLTVQYTVLTGKPAAGKPLHRRWVGVIA
jgi:hypothetical protein